MPSETATDGAATVGQWLALGHPEAAFQADGQGRGEALLSYRQGRPEASLHEAELHSVEAVRDALDPGTLLLAFAVEDAATHVFVIDHENGLLAAHSLAIGADALAKEVRHLLAAIAGARKEGTQYFDRFQELSRWFYGQLLAPFDALIEDSARLLIVPDGALHRLPFSSLIRPVEMSGSEQYLIEWKPLHTVISTSVYAELMSAPRSTLDRHARLVAFGDAEYSSGSATDSESSGLGDRHGRQALPGSGREVRSIASHFPNHRLYLGKDATKANLESLDPEVDILHLSAHGQRDATGDQQARLFLSPEHRHGAKVPGSGHLEVGEILAGHVAPAGLVVVSACDSALGPDRDDGANLGLGWAFLANGARSVVSSLWRIDDQHTADLMDRFYAELAAGVGTAEALRQAQLELIQGPGGTASAPHFWAAFQLQGDWR